MLAPPHFVEIPAPLSVGLEDIGPLEPVKRPRPAWLQGCIGNRISHAGRARCDEMFGDLPFGQRSDRRNRHASDELDLVDGVELLARRYGDFDIVAHLLADQRTGQR